MKLLSSIAMITLFGSLSCHHPADCYQCNNDVFYGLTVQEYKDGVDRYKHFRSDIIDGTVLRDIKPDARSCWYSIDTLRKFICLLEQYSQQLGIPPDSLGIRFEYAVYPDTFPQKQIYSRLHTLFMVATCKQQGMNIDFDPRYLGTVFHSPTTVDSLLNAGAIAHLQPGVQLFELDLTSGNAGVQPGTLSVLSKNQGQLCPNYPNCPTN